MSNKSLESNELLENIEATAIENMNEVTPLKNIESSKEITGNPESVEEPCVEMSSCPCSGSCGSNYSITSGCPCSGSCGSNYHK